MANPQQDLLDAINNLTKTIGNMNGTSNPRRRRGGKDDSIDVMKFFERRTGIENVLVKATEVQAKALQRNVSVNELINLRLSQAAPLLANLEGSLKVFEAGLDDNAEGLGDFVNRAGILGENLDSLLTGVRDLRLNLALSREEEIVFTQSIMNAAKTYQTSTEGVVTSLNKFGETLAILNRTQSGQTNDLIVNLAAMTDRFAPGALQGILQPLLSQGGQSLGRIGVLGGQTGISNMIEGTGQLSDVLQVLKGVVQARDTFVPTGVNAIVGSEILKATTGQTLAQANQAERLIEIIEKQMNTQTLEAGLKDALGSLNDIMLTFKEPFTAIVNVLAKMLEMAKPIFQSGWFKAVVSFLAWTAIFRTISALIGTLIAATKLNGRKGISILGLIFSIGATIWSKTLEASEKTAKNTGDIAAQANAARRARDLELVDRYNKLHAGTIGALIRANARQDTDNRLGIVNAQIQREKTNMLMQQVVTEAERQRAMTEAFNRGQRSGFRPGNGGKP